MQKEIKRIHVLQAGLLQGILLAAFGLIIGLLYGLMFFLMGTAGAMSMSTASSTSGSGAPGPGGMMAMMGGMGLVMVILIPIFYGAMGFIGGIIGAAVYNLVAKFVGGFKIDLVDIGPLPNQLETTAVSHQ